MVHYYLDIETYSTGESPGPQDKIIAIILCAIDPQEGTPIQEPIILTSWQSSEKEIIDALAHRMLHGKPFDFVPVGFSLLFDLWMLRHKFAAYGYAELTDRFFLETPFVDLKHVAILANGGKFKGVKLGGTGNPVREWYEQGQYDRIRGYMLEKLEKFSSAYQVWSQRLRD